MPQVVLQCIHYIEDCQWIIYKAATLTMSHPTWQPFLTLKSDLCPMEHTTQIRQLCWLSTVGNI